jgi:hypothetical protein
MFFIDPVYLILMAPVLLFSLYAQAKVKSSYKKYANLPSGSGVTGAQAARALLDRCGLSEVAIEEVPGTLSDHYDSRTKVLRLSSNVHNGTSLAALGVAAHESGHAAQDKTGYVPMRIRAGLVPVANLGSQLALPIFFVGLMVVGWFNSPFGGVIMTAAIIIFAAAVFFQIVTLPVEYNASRRGLAMLLDTGLIGSEEAGPVKKVLGAAALTYVAAAASALMTLLYMIIRSRDD